MLLFSFGMLVSNLSKAQETRFAVAGLEHGHVHWVFQDAFQGNYSFVGISETNKELANNFKQRYNVPDSLFFTDLEEMLDKVKPTAVVAFGPTNSHIEVVRLAAPKGLHVMVEKPLATTIEDAIEIEKLAKANNIHVLTNYETSWYPATDAVINKVHASADDFGQLRKAVFHHGHKGPKEIGVEKEFLDWLIDPIQNGGGALMDFGCYGANIMTFMMRGEMPISVGALVQTHKPDIYKEVDDEATILVEYATSQAIIQGSWNWPFDRKDMDVYGEFGKMHAINRNTIKTRMKGADSENTMLLTADQTKTYTNPFNYFKAVIDGELEMPSFGLYTLENNVRVVQILDAAKRSSQEVRIVYFKSDNQ